MSFQSIHLGLDSTTMNKKMIFKEFDSRVKI
jgi:hypothetical protein